LQPNGACDFIFAGRIRLVDPGTGDRRRADERWDTWRPDHRVVDCNIGVFERSVPPVMQAELVELVDDQHRISASIAMGPAHGATAGHSMSLEAQSQ
jgi:hypothetical protein